MWIAIEPIFFFLFWQTRCPWNQFAQVFDPSSCKMILIIVAKVYSSSTDHANLQFIYIKFLTTGFKHLWSISSNYSILYQWIEKNNKWSKKIVRYNSVEINACWTTFLTHSLTVICDFFFNYERRFRIFLNVQIEFLLPNK